jgi:hypothetical protein
MTTLNVYAETGLPRKAIICGCSFVRRRISIAGIAAMEIIPPFKKLPKINGQTCAPACSI